MSAYDYIEQQEIIRKVSENYTGEHYDEYNQEQDEGESSNKKPELGLTTTLGLVTLSAHNKVLAFENFRYLLESLEEYVEKMGYYPDFRSKRQLLNITIPKEKNYSLVNCKELFRTKLLLFVGVLGNDTPDDTKKEIQEQFYK